ncbi:hypothetical protein DL766_008769 [Monosporascus sp. MC13-8B]|uniref:RING-type domain-containing protein n=1 Tax=Monosporascus cannonballus TaxID=155416 RepID=A0ABY0HAP4_9PEZI|nr:hypothetical protein DL763_006752 [Monosporascus cannonballus]RYO89094.1 hypothetical protein DL762_003374 [Monosporascus cannonballus]RYP18060.1 hypothetical protein DL766_008769 [Monosporascus sp. MC13-8B]
MASNSSQTRHLDATSGREVVFCHQCENEWYKDEHGDSLTCPRCHGEATEIVEPENDPRPMNQDFFSDPDRHRPHRRHYADTDSDPDEPDIDDHFIHGPGGFFGHRSIFRAPERPSPRNAERAAPDDGEAIIRRFTELLGDIGGPLSVGRSGPDTLFHEGGGGSGGAAPQVTYRRISGPGFRGGMSSFTITTGPVGGRIRQGGPGPGPADDEEFTRIFGSMFGGPPPMPPRSPRGEDDPTGPNVDREPRNPDFAMALHQLFASFLNPRAVQGDVVYSQEALDQIITNLMEANPQSNAPPPASEDAIAKLSKKKLDSEMLGPELKGECTICIDEVNVGDEITVLPCKHWFHNDCVVLWLKQHNTCPICRASITGEAAGQPRGDSSASQPGPSGFSPFPRPGPAERRRSNLRNRGEARLDSIRDLANPHDRRQTPRRDSNSPPMESPLAQSPRPQRALTLAEGSVQRRPTTLNAEWAPAIMGDVN